MTAGKKDPTDAMRLAASRYPEVDEGTACTQSSFKTGGKAFLFVGMQGGRHKAMFKLKRSLPEAAELAAKEPDRFSVGSTAWVSARFTADEPLPAKLWKKWLDESYELSRASGAGRGASKQQTPKQASKKKAAKKRAAKKAAGRATPRRSR